jgi:glycosyltransferase involved in cell wall biosynthesis
MEGWKISVIVPVYNVEKYITKCIESILSNTYKDFELILVDDCSIDNSLNICEEYSKKDGRIKIIKNSENVGASLSRKKGLEISTGKYIQFIDSDDWIENNMIEEMIKKAETENLDMVFCDIYDHHSNRILRDNIFEKSEKIKDIITIFGICSVCTKLARREVFDKVIFPGTNFAEDRFITLQTIYFSNNFAYINKPMYHYEYNKSSTTKKQVNEKRIIDLFDTYILIIDFIKTNSIKNLEPELSEQINLIKLMVLKDKHARKNCSISKLYSESNFHKYLLKRIYKLLVPKLFQAIKRRIKRKINCNR